MIMNVILVRSTAIEIQVDDDFDPDNTEHVARFQDQIDEALEHPLDWDSPRKASVSSVTCPDYQGDAEDLLDLID